MKSTGISKRLHRVTSVSCFHHHPLVMVVHQQTELQEPLILAVAVAVVPLAVLTLVVRVVQVM